MAHHSLDHARYYGAEEEPNTPLLSISSKNSGPLDILHEDDEEEDDEEEADTSSQKMTSKKKMILWLGFFFLVALILLLVTFFAIIPAIMQDITDDEQLSMSTTTIFNPAEDSFEVISTISFSDKPMLPATAKMHNTDLSWEGVHLAVMTHNNKLNVDTPPQSLHSSVVITDVSAMSDFNIFLMDIQSFDWHIHGHADAIALNDKVDVLVEKDITMRGFDNFPVDPVIQSVSVYAGSSEVLYSLSTTLLFSPSNIALSFGQDLIFDLKSNDIKVGVGTISMASFQTGEFAVNTSIAMSFGSPAETAEVNKVCGRFICQLPTVVTMENFRLAQPIAWLTPALSSLRFESVLPPVQEWVIDSLDMFVYPLDVLNVLWGGHFFNPLDVVLTLYSMKCDILFENEVIAQVDEPDIEIIIPPRTHIVSENDMRARTVLAHTKQVLDLLAAGGGLLDLDCQIHNSMGDFMVDLQYVQGQVPSQVHQGRPPSASSSLSFSSSAGATSEV